MLLDTGPLVAHLDAADQWHHVCQAHWDEMAARVLTTEAVVTEACYFFARAGGPAWLPLEFVVELAIPVVPLEGSLHDRCIRLMREYANLPMDYADASLVAAAEALGIGQAFTTDRRGFSVYRAAGRAFEIVPGRS